MADDIMGLLFSTYNNASTGSSSMASDKTAVNQAVGQTIATKNMTTYKEEEKLIAEIRKNEVSHYKELYKSELEYHKYSQKVKKDLLKQENEHYTELYNLKKKIHEKETTLLEEERNIRQEIANSGKVTLGDLASLYTKQQEIAKLEKETLEYKERQFKKGVDTVKQAFGTIVQHIMNYVNDWDNLMRWNQLDKGIKDSGSQYEQNFTEIAGRLGSNSQIATHSMLKDSLNSVINNSALKAGLNFNNEVFPAITEAVQKGFTTDAEDIAISNAIDKKIMPWLETSSETWVQMQYNMSDEALLRYKSDQLMLQATQEGNRLLQNGVISQITDSILPSLDNIVANTTEVEDLNDEMYAKVMYLMNDMGYSKQEAIKAVNKEIEAYQNPFKALTSGDTGDKLLAIDNLWGTDLVGNFASSMIGSGWAGSGAFFDLTGLASGGETRTERGLLTYAGMESAQNKYIKQYGLDKDNSEQYDISKLLEYTTATQQHDNTKQNLAADAVFDKNLQVHGIDLAALQLNELKEIKTWLITGLSVMLLTKLTDKLTDGFIKNVLSKFKGGGASSSGGNILGNIGGKLGSGLMPGAGSVPGAGKLGFMSSGTGAILGSTAGVAAGALIAKEGFEGIHEANQVINDKSSLNSEIESAKFSKGASGVAAGAGIAGAGAILALGASNPIGWIALAVGGLALGAKAINDHVNRLSGLSEQYEAHGEELKSAFQKEQQTRIEESAFLKQSILSAKTDKEAQNEVINSGLLSEKTARDLTSKELSTLTTEIIKTESAITALGNAAIDAKTKVAKEEAQQQTKDVLDDTYNNIKSLLGSDNVVKQGDAEYAQIKAMFEGMASSIINDEERKLMQEQLNTMFAEGEFDLAELDVLMNKGGTWRSMWHTTIDRKRNFYDYAMDVESANAYLGIIDGNGSYDLGDVTIDQNTAAWQVSMDEWYKTYNNSSDTATKEAAKNKFLDIWNTNIKPNTDYYEYLQPKYKSKAEAMGITGFKLGSTYIPSDMIAMLHAGERVLTAGQNKEYTDELTSGNSASSIIQAGVQDIVIAIKTQTTEIINYLSTVSFNNSSFGNSQINMLPAMGNTKVTI